MGACCQKQESNLQIEIRNSYEGYITESSTPNNIRINEIRIQKPFFMCSQKVSLLDCEFPSQKKLNRMNNQAGLSPILASVDNDIESSEGTAKRIVYNISQKMIVSPGRSKKSTSSRIERKRNAINMEQLEDLF